MGHGLPGVPGSARSCSGFWGRILHARLTPGRTIAPEVVFAETSVGGGPAGVHTPEPFLCTVRMDSASLGRSSAHPGISASSLSSRWSQRWFGQRLSRVEGGKKNENYLTPRLPFEAGRSPDCSGQSGAVCWGSQPGRVTLDDSDFPLTQAFWNPGEMWACPCSWCREYDGSHWACLSVPGCLVRWPVGARSPLASVPGIKQERHSTEKG